MPAGVVEGLPRVVRAQRGDSGDGLLRRRGLVRGLVGHPAVDAGVPRVEHELAARRPAAVAQAQLQPGDAHDPVGGGAQHGHLVERGERRGGKREKTRRSV